MTEPKIRILGEDVVGKISAGEVVERPASAVKELIENSIDAGADSISIEVESAGQALIRIADNGAGMSAEDARLACLRHATSKLRNIGDLDRLSTFGFRGEALASIAAVSRTEITTCRSGDNAGTALELESGQISRMKPVGRSRGTTVEVRNLFYNVPARRKFLKTEATELAEIASVIGHFIVSYPDVEFRFQSGSRTILHATKGMGDIDRMRLVLGADVAENMVDVGLSSGELSVRGYVSRPSSTRKDRASQLFFVNGRHVKSKILGDALYDAYTSMLERGRYPSAVLFVSIPSSAIDVNVHPTKLLVKFDNEKEVKTLITNAVRRRFDALKAEKALAQEVHFIQTPMPQSRGDAAGAGAFIADAPAVQGQFTYEINKDEVRSRSASWGWPSAKAGMITSGSGSAEIFQVGNCYIVRMGEDHIEITDQHAAHERVFYEYFTRVVSGGAHDLQSLLFPVRIDLSSNEAMVMSKAFEPFKRLGFYIEPFGERSYVVQSVPAILKDRDIKTVVMDALSDLSERDLNRVDIIDEMVKIMSCRAAVKAGDKLTVEEMYSVLDQLHKCELPFTCPHGRPTLIELKIDDLEKMFRRK